MAKKSAHKEVNNKIPEAELIPPSAGKSLLVWELLAAVLSAVLTSLAFPPAGWSCCAWFGLVPLLLMPTPRSWLSRFAVGYVFGYIHFLLSLYWLNQVGFGAAWLLSIWCGLFPAAWYSLASCWNWWLKDEKTAPFPGAGCLYIQKDITLALTALFYSVLWVLFEYGRSFILTGFPWNLLGVSQYQCIPVIQIASYTGVFGISFIIMLANSCITAELSRQLRGFIAPVKRSFPWHILLLALAIVPVVLTQKQVLPEPPPDTPILQIAAIQGNLPQCRNFTREEFDDARNTYMELTKEAHKAYPNADLFIWPECAVPASIDDHTYRVDLYKLLETTEKPLILGALRSAKHPESNEDSMTNSAFLLGKKLEILDFYHKIHRVPFGEFTPLGKYFPWLVDFIGMGRDLVPGRETRVFHLPKNAKAGINICFEDAFPEISRELTQKGANMLFTITNDSWYNHSCGAQQHLAQMVFRAVENRRPYLRSGNNSHTCMVAPDGRILGQITDPRTGSPFTRDFQAYDIPAWDTWGTSFYTLHGNIFAKCSSAAAMILLLFPVLSALAGKHNQLKSLKKATK